MLETIDRPQTRETTSNVPPKKRENHIVERVNGKPTDKCLCGYLWDRLPRVQDAEMCQECVAEYVRRTK